MSIFRRRRAAEPADPDGTPDAMDMPGDGDDGDEVTDDLTDDGVRDGVDGSDAPDTPALGTPRVPGTGPFDVSEADDAPRLDVGALRLPLVGGVELQLQVDEESGQVTGVFVVMGESAVQLQAFAAPRHEGIWREIAEEIAAGITEQGGTADFASGPLGDELLARVPAQQPDGRVGFQPLRFTGVDGPRWLLRAVFHGSAAVEPSRAVDLEAFVQQVVVVRGAEPMGPRELLPLHLPVEATDADDAAVAAAEADATDDLDPFERGPEITEIR